MRLLFSILVLLFGQTLEARLPDLIPYRKGELWGFCDSTRKILVEPQWKSVRFYSGNTAKVSDGKWWGLIDRSGKEITEIKYDWISDETANGTRIACRFRNGKKGAINDRGEVVVPFDYEWLLLYGNYLQGMKNDKCGFFNSQGKIIVSFIYNGYGDVPESLNIPGRFAVLKKDKCGVVDTAGNTVIPFHYKWISAAGCGYISAWSRNENEPTYYDRNGNVADRKDTCEVRSEVRLYKPFRNVSEQGNPYTWLDTNGHKPTTLRFMMTGNFSNGYAAYQGFDSLYGFVNDRFEVVYPPTFTYVNAFDEHGLAHVWVRDAHCRSCKLQDGYVDWHGTKYWED